MPPLIRTAGFLLGTLTVTVALRYLVTARLEGPGGGFLSSLLLFALPFLVGDWLARGLALEKSPRTRAREFADGAWTAVALQAVLWAFWVAATNEMRRFVPWWIAMGQPLAAFAAGFLGRPGPRIFARRRWPVAADLPAFARRVAVVGGAFAGLGVALQLAGGDRWLLAAPFAFALPLPVVALAAAAAALAWWVGRRPRLAVWTLGAAVAVAAVALALDYRTTGRPRAGGRDTVRLVSWNVQHRETRALVPLLRTFDADVLVVVEGDGPGRWADALPDHQVCDPGAGLVILARKPLADCEKRRLGERSRAIHAVAGFDPPLGVVAVDLEGHPLVRRRPAIDNLGRLLAGRWAGSVVAGDFNTPRRAWSLVPLASTHTSAFTVAGRGWAPTWPEPFPVLEIDQVWLPPSLTALRAVHGRGAGTDHRPVIVELAPRARGG